MPGPNVIVEMDANETRLLAAFQRAEHKMSAWARNTGKDAREVNRMTSKMVKDMGRAANKTIEDAKKGDSAFSNMTTNAVTNLGKVAGAYVGVQQAIQLVTTLIEEQNRVLDDAKDAHLTLAAAQDSAAKNLVNLPADQRKALLGNIPLEAAKAMGFGDVGSLVEGLGKAVSSGANFEEAREIMRAAIPMSRTSQSSVDELMEAGIGIGSATGLSAKQSLSLGLSIGGESAVTDNPKMFKRIVAPMIAAGASGPDEQKMRNAVQGGAVWSVLTKRAGDKEGDVSRNDTVLFVRRMKNFFDSINEQSAAATKELAELRKKGPDKLSPTQLHNLDNLQRRSETKDAVDNQMNRLEDRLLGVQDRIDSGLRGDDRRLALIEKRKIGKQISDLAMQMFDESDQARLDSLIERRTHNHEEFAKKEKKLLETIAVGQRLRDPGDIYGRIIAVQEQGLAEEFKKMPGARGSEKSQTAIDEFFAGGEAFQMLEHSMEALNQAAGSTQEYDRFVREQLAGLTPQQQLAQRQASIDAADMLQDVTSHFAALSSQIRETVADALGDTRTGFGVSDYIDEIGIRKCVTLGGAPGSQEAISGVKMLLDRMHRIQRGGITPQEAPHVARLRSDVASMESMFADPLMQQDPHLESSLRQLRHLRATGAQRTRFADSIQANPALIERLIETLELQVEIQKQQLEMASQSASANQATANAASQTATNTDPANRRPDTATAMRVANELRNRSTGR